MAAPDSGTRYSSAFRRVFNRERAITLKRDKTCKECNRRRAVVGAHIIPVKQGGANHHSNMRGLCRSCHSKETFHRGENGRGKMRTLRSWLGGLF